VAGLPVHPDRGDLETSWRLGLRAPAYTGPMEPVERNLGEQPLARLLVERGLSPKDLVQASTEQLTHKMVARGAKGRRLTPNTQAKVLNALNTATGGSYALSDLFDYA